ncbi:MAG: hypothetical protein U0Y10_19075 [Spirosomataceae bacterium]|mgnify:CR=1 FL=1
MFKVEFDEDDLTPLSKADLAPLVNRYIADLLKIDSISDVKGVYIYSFECNYNRFKKDEKFAISPSSNLLLAAVQQSGKIGCSICNTSLKKHKLLVLNLEEFFNSIAQKDIPEYENVMNDKEWLLTSLDFMSNDNGYWYASSRIPVADFWDVNFYSIKK